MTVEVVEHTELEVGDKLDPMYDETIVVEVLRPAVETTETVPPLFGRPVWRYWCRREDTGEEGFMSFGAGGVTRRIVKR